jgi:hypothetical protein
MQVVLRGSGGVDASPGDDAVRSDERGAAAADPVGIRKTSIRVFHLAPADYVGLEWQAELVSDGQRR